eukprot:755372-Hanusia_phi.AAC.7
MRNEKFPAPQAKSRPGGAKGLAGIGVTFEMGRKGLKVTGCHPEGPAAKCKLIVPGDVLVQVMVACRGWSVECRVPGGRGGRAVDGPSAGGSAHPRQRGYHGVFGVLAVEQQEVGGQFGSPNSADKTSSDPKALERRGNPT